MSEKFHAQEETGMQGADKPLPVALTGLSVAISTGAGGISRVIAGPRNLPKAITTRLR
jgi:hypothetical protein